MGGASTGGRQYIAAGMFLFATLGFVVVQIDRQRKQRDPAGHRHPHRVPPLPRQRPQGRPRGRRPAAPRADLAPPRPVGPAGARRGPYPGLGARQRRPALPARPVRRLRPAARRSSWSPPESDRRRPGRPGRRLGAAPAARRAPAAAGPARVGRPARLRPDRGVRPRGAGPLAGPGDDLLGDRVPLPRAPRVAVLTSEQNLAHWDWVKWLPHAPERPAVRRGRAEADGVDVARRAGRAAAGRPERAAAVRRRRAAGHPAHPAS